MTERGGRTAELPGARPRPAGARSRPAVKPREHERARRVRPPSTHLWSPRRWRGRRPGRRPRWLSTRRLAWLGASLLVLVVALGWLFYFSPVLTVRSVQVQGGRSGTSDAVLALAAVPQGQPLARVDVQAVADRLRGMAELRSVTVVRSWPATIRIDVQERSPVALVDAPDGLWLIDGSGVRFAQVTDAPPGLPVLEVARPVPGDRATEAALQVVQALPERIRTRVSRVSAQTADSVVLHMSGGRTISWGDAQDSAAKAEALDLVFGQPGMFFDVSSPTAIVVR